MAGLQTAFNSNTYRIVEYCLLKFFKTNDIVNFNYLEYSDERPNPTLFKHFISPENQSDIEQAVWTNGEYAHRINKVYDSLPLVTPIKNNETSATKVSVVLKQGFSWTDVFGIHVIIKGTNSQDIYASKVLFINDFKINDSKELIQGSFWFEQSDILIPRTDEILACQITTIKYEDIQADGPNIGYIYNFPETLEPLIAEKPIPDFIQTNLDIDVLSNYIKIKPITTEAKSLEKSILDYFGQTTADISIEHVVRFGNDEDGYQSIRVSNEHNMFGEITLGLDFTQFEKTNSYEEIADAIKDALFSEIFEEVAQLRIKNAELLAQQLLDKKSIKDLTDALVIKTNKVKELELNITGLNSIITEKTTEITDLKASNSSLTQQLNVLTQQLETSNALIVTKNAEIDNLNIQIITLNNTITSLNAIIVERNNTITTNNRKISELESTVATQAAEIVKLNTTITSKNTEIINLNTSLETATNLVTEKNVKIRELETEIQDKKQQITEKDLTISELRADVMTLVIRIESKDEQISTLTTNRDYLQQLVDEATTKIQSINS